VSALLVWALTCVVGMSGALQGSTLPCSEPALGDPCACVGSSCEERESVVYWYSIQYEERGLRLEMSRSTPRKSSRCNCIFFSLISQKAHQGFSAVEGFSARALSLSCARAVPVFLAFDCVLSFPCTRAPSSLSFISQVTSRCDRKISGRRAV
jgi:hypothetical protein